MHYELLKRVVAELDEKLSNARVAKIHQPAAEILIFRLWNGRENLRLLVSAAPRSCRIQLTAATLPNPFTPPRFCQLLRARVTRIHSVTLLNEDRIVSILCSGPKGESSLIVELTGRRSNLLLLDSEQRIIDALQRSSGTGDARLIGPGQMYQLPEKGGANIEEGAEPEADPGLTANELVDKLYTQGQRTESKTDLFNTVQLAVAKQQQKLQRRLEKISEEQGRQANAEQFKLSGELLLANLQQLRRGMATAELLNYYLQPPAITRISLEPKLSPQENAARYFKLYKKAVRGQEHSRRRWQETHDELQWLETIAFQLTEAGTAGEIEEIAGECRQSGLLRAGKDRYGQKPKAPVPQPYEAVSPSGYKVLWGRNNRQNDYLTTKLMKTGDLWFHAAQCPGAHVLLKGAGAADNLPDADLRYAAALAAGYSQSRDSHKVEVMVAEPKHVNKPKGANPGLVRVRQHKTLIVKPVRLG